MGLYKGSSLISPTQIVKETEVSDETFESILTIKQVVEGGTKENESTEITQACNDIKRFLNGSV